MTSSILVLHALPVLGFVLAIILIAHLLRQHKPPASTLAWLLAIVLMPHIGVPLYLVFGGRKLKRMAAAKAPLFPNGIVVSPGNTISLLPDGEQAFQRVLDVIEGAQHTLFVATFILGRDVVGQAVIDALARKAREGVNVRLLLDAWGSMSVTRRFLEPLVSAGGKVAFFMPMIHLPFRGRANLRNHRKIVVSDDAIAIIGGMNLSERYMGAVAGIKRWPDLSLLIKGPAALQLGNIFRADWAFASGESLYNILPPPSSGTDEEVVALRVIASGPDIESDTLRSFMVSTLCKVQSRVWIVTPYFVPDELLHEMLCLAARRGSDVRLIIPARSNHRLADLARQGYLLELQQAGGKVMLYERGMVHAKIMLVDDALSITGSANMDVRSLLLNYEVAVACESPEMSKALETWVNDLMGYCVDCGEQPNSIWRELGYGIGRLFAPLL